MLSAKITFLCTSWDALREQNRQKMKFEMYKEHFDN